MMDQHLRSHVAWGAGMLDPHLIRRSWKRSASVYIVLENAPANTPMWAENTSWPSSDTKATVEDALILTVQVSQMLYYISKETNSDMHDIARDIFDKLFHAFWMRIA
jgi:hypothetical protein